jgi:two-component system response regulator HydG
VFPINIPPLRERKEDIPLLVSHFIKKGNEREDKSIKGIDNSGMKQLLKHLWPGNIRELENAIEHAFVICNSDRIQLNDLPVEISEGKNPGTYDFYISPVSNKINSFNTKKSLDLTKDDLIELLDDCNWNKAEVGRRIQKSRTSVWKYMKKWDIPLQR